MDCSISCQLRIRSLVHGNFPGVLCLSWLYSFFCFFFQYVLVCFVVWFCRKFSLESKKKSLHLCPPCQQSSEQQPSSQLSQAKHILHILPASRALPVRAYTHTHTGPILWKQTHILLNKGLTTAPHLAVLVQCLILLTDTPPASIPLITVFPPKMRPHT